MADPVGMVRLTAKQIGPKSEALGRPKIYDILAGDIKNLRRAGTGSVIEDGRKPVGQFKVELYENPSQVRLNVNVTRGITSGIYDSDMALGVVGAGSDLANATQLAKYFNKVSAVTGATADGVKLLATPTVGQTCVVLNAGSAACDVFPNTATSKIDSLAVSAVKSVAVGQSIHFLCTVGGASASWKSAIDEINT